MTETSTLWVCVDCYFEHATGNDMRDPSVSFDRPPLGLLPGADLSAGLTADEHADDCPVWLGDPNRPDVPVREAECECEHDDFSSRACPGCGSTLAGERHAVTLWHKTADDIAEMIARVIVADGWTPFTVTPYGVAESAEHAPDVYWADEHITVDHDVWDVVGDFHPSESITTAGHVRHHLWAWLDGLAHGESFSVTCAEIVDPEDPEAIIGWALLARDVPRAASAYALRASTQSGPTS